MTLCHRCTTEIQGEPIPVDSTDASGWPVKDAPHCPACVVQAERDRALRAHWETVEATFEGYLERIPEAHRGGLDIELPEDLDWNGEPWALLLKGPNGVGKSWLATRVLKKLVVTKREEHFGFWSVLALDLALKKGFSNGQTTDLLDDVCHAPLLVLDDLRQARLTEYSEHWGRTLIAIREEHRLPTIFTVDRSLEALDPMLQSRLKGARVYEIKEKTDVANDDDVMELQDEVRSLRDKLEEQSFENAFWEPVAKAAEVYVENLESELLHSRRRERLEVASRVLAGMWANPNPYGLTNDFRGMALHEADALIALVDSEGED